MSERKEKWTPGPWDIKTNPTCHTIKTAGEFGEAGGRQVCNVPKPNNPESTANVHLVAAAPELYRLAKAAMEWIDSVPKDAVLPTMPGFDRDWADTVLAAARGENQ